MTEQRPGIIPGKVFVEWLRAAGIVGERVYRVVIDASVRDVVKVYVEQYGTDLIMKAGIPPEIMDAPIYEFGASGIPIFPIDQSVGGRAWCLVCSAPDAKVVTDIIETTRPTATHKEFKPLKASAFCAEHMREPVTIDADGQVMTASQKRTMDENFGAGQ